MMAKTATINFLLGLSVGLVFAYLAVTYLHVTPTYLVANRRLADNTNHAQVTQETNHGGVDTPQTDLDLSKVQHLVKQVDFHDEHQHHGKALKAMNVLFQHVRKMDFTPKTLCQLLDAFVESTANYACEVWGNTKSKEIERIHLKFLKRILGVKLSSCNAGVYGDLDDEKEARELYKTVRILCWVMTSPANLDKKTVHVRNTWAKRCNKVLFISSTTNDSFPTVGLNVSEGPGHLTAKTMQAFRYVYEKHFDDADWFMKADDDTYVIVENMRYLLKDEDPNKPIYFGHYFKSIVPQGFFSGGAGYIISKEALRRFGAQSTNASICRQDGFAEDVNFGFCMQRLGIKTGNSTDRLGRSRFHCFTPSTLLHGGYPNWYYKHVAHPQKGQESISDYAITFHYISPHDMYALEFYVYHLRPYGIHSGNQQINHDHKN